MATSPNTESPNVKSPNVISSIILALRRMAPSDPERLLSALVDPEPPKDHDYRFLDAFTALCSSLSQCESASAAIHEDGPEFGRPTRLYIATYPSASPGLRTQINALYRALHKVTQSSSGRNDSPNYSTARSSFVGQAYRSCGGRLLNAIKRNDSTEELLKDLSSELSTRGTTEDCHAELADKLRIIVNKGMNTSFSDSELLDLHRVGLLIRGLDGKFLHNPCEPWLSPLILSHANIPVMHCLANSILRDMRNIAQHVDILIAWATFRGRNLKTREGENSGSAASKGEDSKRVIGSGVIFVDRLTVPDFLATTNECEMTKIVDGVPYRDIPRTWDVFKPSGAVWEVEDSSGRFTGYGTVHCETSLLHYINTEKPPIRRYIGCSRPICYVCLMLVEAYNLKVSGTKSGRLSVGRRSANLKELDVAWSYPPDMDSSIHQNLEKRVPDDFKTLCTSLNDQDSHSSPPGE